ncbi:MAG: SpoIID/LytB domain-containing protein [Vicinamibacterales bacterium]
MCVIARRFGFVLAALLFVRCVEVPGPRATELPSPPPSVALGDLRVSVGGRVVSVALEEYVVGTALSEVSPVGESPDVERRIFEVQAILARTYAVAHLRRHAADGYDLCDGTHCQLYQPGRLTTSRFAPTARQAVTRTAGKILTFGGRPAEALYHSDCGGHTSPSTTAWGGSPVPYLAGGADILPPGTHHLWTLTLSNLDLRSALNAEPRTAVGRRLDRVSVPARDASGRIAEIELLGEKRVVLRGEQFRAAVNAKLGDRAIQSTRFTVVRMGSAFRFTGSGFGHGVGVCQVGAAARARRGESVETILRTYLPGTRLAADR